MLLTLTAISLAVPLQQGPCTAKAEVQAVPLLTESLAEPQSLTMTGMLVPLPIPIFAEYEDEDTIVARCEGEDDNNNPVVLCILPKTRQTAHAQFTLETGVLAENTGYFLDGEGNPLVKNQIESDPTSPLVPTAYEPGRAALYQPPRNLFPGEVRVVKIEVLGRNDVSLTQFAEQHDSDFVTCFEVTIERPLPDCLYRVEVEKVASTTCDPGFLPPTDPPAINCNTGDPVCCSPVRVCDGEVQAGSEISPSFDAKLPSNNGMLVDTMRPLRVFGHDLDKMVVTCAEGVPGCADRWDFVIEDELEFEWTLPAGGGGFVIPGQTATSGTDKGRSVIYRAGESPGLVTIDLVVDDTCILNCVEPYCHNDDPWPSTPGPGSIEIPVYELDFIRQDNSLIPHWDPAFPNASAALMVSKKLTNENINELPTATYDGPTGTEPDPDTFRLQVTGPFSSEMTPKIRLDLIKNPVYTAETTAYSHVFQMFKDPNAPPQGNVTYRMSEHVRLVSNAPLNPGSPPHFKYDDEEHASQQGMPGVPALSHLPDHQTIRVSLGDHVRATLLIDELAPGQPLQEYSVGSIELSVGQPTAPGGTQVLAGTLRWHNVEELDSSGDPAGFPPIDEFFATRRLNEDWAQIGIRFDIQDCANEVTPVTNALVLTDTGPPGVDQGGTFTTNVTLVSSPGEPTINIPVTVAAGDSMESVATSLANAWSAHPLMDAEAHHHTMLGDSARWLVIVNPGTDVDFGPNSGTVSGFRILTNEVNYTEGWGDLEAHVLAINYADEDHATVDIFSLADNVQLSFAATHAVGGSYNDSDLGILDAAVNTVFVRQDGVDSNDSGSPFILAHELSHVLLNFLHTDNPVLPSSQSPYSLTASVM